MVDLGKLIERLLSAADSAEQHMRAANENIAAARRHHMTRSSG
jgi:hypothetical protein